MSAILFRYYPADSQSHYTAIPLKENKVLQVKPDRKMFSSKEEWILSLPGNPSESNIRISDENPARKPDPNWKFTPTYDDENWTWPAKIYNIIMQANPTLKENEDLRQAFNHLVDVIDTYKNYCVVYIEKHSSNDLSKYDNIFLCAQSKWFKKEVWELLPIKYRGVDPTDHWYYNHPPILNDLGPKIYEAYMPLFGLMETHGVLNFVRKKIIDIKKEQLNRRIRCAEAEHRRVDRKKDKLVKQIAREKAAVINYSIELQEELEDLEEELQELQGIEGL
jgi:hypothetical protein